MKFTAIQAYKAVGLRDFGRMDMRFFNGIPYILDINELPDLAPDSGYANTASLPVTKCRYGEHLIIRAGTRGMAMINIPNSTDGETIVKVAASTGFFSPEEIDCVAELWEEYIHKGAIKSGYHFLVDHQNGHLRGFACFGPRALAEGVYDLFWIAVDKAFQGQGIGKMLLRQVESEIKQLGGRLVVVETSGQPKYAPTRGFYHAAGYMLEATLKDFYHEGDDLVIFTRRL